MANDPRLTVETIEAALAECLRARGQDVCPSPATGDRIWNIFSDELGTLESVNLTELARDMERWLS